MPDDAKRDAVQKSGEPDAPPPPVVEQPIGSSDAAEIAKSDVNTKINNLGDELHKAERWMIYLTGAIAFFGLCAVIVGAFQWCAMRGQLTEMQEEQRPWIAAKFTCVVTEDEYNNLVRTRKQDCGRPNLFENMKNGIEPILWWIDVIHSGNSPALHAKLSGNWCLSNRPDDNPPTLAECENGKAHFESPERPLIPGGDDRMAVGDYKDSPPLTLEKSQVDEIVLKRQTFYIVARATYTDTAKNPHWSNFCFKYVPNFGMSFCRGGQETDGDQKPN